MSMNNMNTNGHKVDTFNTFISSFFSNISSMPIFAGGRIWWGM